MKMGDPVAEVAAPAATYRLQLNSGFSFDDAVRVVPYLARLGVSHVYCSPLLRARKGSTHGYDVVDHSAINPELGGAEGFERLVAALRAHGMGLIADVVPNHMGVFGDDNAWWMDVLQNGEQSRYAHCFDIEWQPGNADLRGKLLAPVLGEHYADALAQGKLQIEQEPEGGVALRYGPHRFPIHPDDHAQARSARTPEELHALLERQRFRLAYWRVAADEINYRRFFDVIDLAALRTEDEAVFEATHDYMLKLAAAGKVDGLRIDHPDGLHDPAQYFERLQAGYAKRRPGASPLYVVIEKIAAYHEEIPASWPVHGSTGYRFAALVNGLFVDDAARARLERVWRGFTGDSATFEDAAHQGRHRILRSSFASELTMLATQLVRLARTEPRTRDYTFNALRDALAEVAAAMPVYRTYIAGKPSEQDERYVNWAIARAARVNRDADASVFGFVREALLGLGGRALRFAMRFQQFSAAVAAKGVEDTAFYFHTPLASLNEVGGNPGRFGVTLRAFHGASADRAAHWPLTMLATSTHDNKRSEDVRQRINVLSEQPGRWRLALRHWHALNRQALTLVDGSQAPCRRDEYLLYQTLLGTFPADGLDAEGLTEYRSRIEQYLLKAAREAKRLTSWFAPNEEYEKALTAFVHALLGRVAPNPFLDDLRSQASALAWFGALNSLSMVLIKYTSPGVPDLYQGNELTDLSLVDPDNRRPVDYRSREVLLNAFNQMSTPRELLTSLPDGRAKLWATWKLLQLRKAHPDLFRRGGYTPLTVRGQAASHVVAYARSFGEQRLIVIAGRLYAKLGTEAGQLPLGEVWKDTRVMLPAAHSVRNMLTDETIETGSSIPLARAFATFPGATLLAS